MINSFKQYMMMLIFLIQYINIKNKINIIYSFEI